MKGLCELAEGLKQHYQSCDQSLSWLRPFNGDASKITAQWLYAASSTQLHTYMYIQYFTALINWAITFNKSAL